MKSGLFSRVGPGVIAGAADDDPSGIATFSIAGAHLGTALLWTSVLTWPLMAAVQMLCARVGLMSGRGLIGALKAKFPKPILVAAAVALFLANTINIGADLSGMADAAEMLTGVRSELFVLVFGGGIAYATVKLKFEQITRALKWLALALFSYVIAGLMLRPDWGSVLRAVLVPTLPETAYGWTVLIGILGTTFSPYFFVWQASHEVEEKKDKRGDQTLAGARVEDVHHRALDVFIGTLFSRIVMFFIILTTALTLHPRGVRIASSTDAAAALGPLSGPFARLLYTLGLIGVGLLVIPVLSASAAYALSETVGWKHGLDEKLRHAREFYTVIIVATAGGMILEFSRINPIQALFWSGVINGVLAPFLLFAVIAVAADRRVMHDKTSPLLERAVVALTCVLMLGAALMVIF